MGRTAMNTDNEIRVATLKLAAEMKKDPRLVPVLIILAALGGGTFSRIKRIRDSIQLPDEIRPPVREDHPDDEALDKPRDPVETGTVDLKVRIARAIARELGRAIKREVRELIQSDEFKERIASEARERAAELIQAVFAEAKTLHKLP